MTENYWLINSNRSRVKRFSRNNQNKDKFLNICLLTQEKFLVFLGKEPPLMRTREELKIDKARDEWRKLIAQGWRRTKPVWEES